MATPGSNVKEDFLEEDPEIRSQKFVLLSFLSPENVLENKDQFFFGEFLKQYEIDYKMKNLESFLISLVRGVNDDLTKEAERLDNAGPDLSGAAALCRKARLNMGGLLESYQQFVKTNDAAIKKTTIKESYDDFLFKHQTKLEEDFFAKNEFRTSIRGLKVRGLRLPTERRWPCRRSCSAMTPSTAFSSARSESGFLGIPSRTRYRTRNTLRTS